MVQLIRPFVQTHSEPAPSNSIYLLFLKLSLVGIGLIVMDGTD